MADVVIDPRRFGRRVGVSFALVVGAMSMLGFVNDWPGWGDRVLLAVGIPCVLALAAWCARAGRGWWMALCFLGALAALAAAVYAGFIAGLIVACERGHCPFS